MSYKKYEVRVHDNGTKEWFLNNKLHREDGSAIEHTDGSKYWYLNGKCHREDGPAVEYPDGTNEWYLNGQFHREGGPAIEWSDGGKSWYLNGKYLTEAEFDKKTGSSSCHGKTVEIDGKKYQLKEIK
jgi:hypothetical protein